MKDFLKLFTVLFLALFVLSGVFGGGGQSSGSKPGVTDLNFLIVAGNDEMPAWNGITDSFNKTHSDIQVTLEQLPGSWDEYFQKITALIAAGTPPDIGRMGVAFMPMFISRNQLADLTAKVNSDLNMNNYYQSAFESVKYNGRIYGIPLGIYTMITYYNKDMFDAAGIPYPSTDWRNSWTIQEFVDIARRLTSGDGPNKKFGALSNFHPERSVPFFFSNGANVLSDDHKTATMNSRGMVDAYRMLQDLVNRGYSPTPSQLQTMPLDQMFTSGRLGMVIEGEWMIPAWTNARNLRWGVAPVPKGSQSATTVNFIDQYVVFSGSKHVEESWQVVKSFIEQAAEEIMADKGIGGIPVFKPVAEGRRSQMFNPLSANEKDVIFNSVDFSKAMPFTPNWNELMTVVSRTTDLMALNEITAEAGLNRINTELTPLLK
jgi:multiple sugar transport system substrate-binding protein